MPPINATALERFGPGRFADKTASMLAGRCLADGIEFLATAPKLDADHDVLVYAHAIRLCWQSCSSLPNCAMILSYLRPHIDGAIQFILARRKPEAPHFGDDYWDWAYVLEALVLVSEGRAHIEVERELRLFVDCISENDAPFVYKHGEWYGPGIPAAAYRFLQSESARSVLQRAGLVTKVQSCLPKLRQLALEPIQNKQYRGRTVSPPYVQWHIGQVAALFPDELRDLQPDSVARLLDTTNLAELSVSDRVFALARVIQGAFAINETATVRRAVADLIALENTSRQFGFGVRGQTVKASLNALEALLPTLDAEGNKDVDAIAVALVAYQTRSGLSTSTSGTPAPQTVEPTRTHGKHSRTIVLGLSFAALALLAVLLFGLGDPTCSEGKQPVPYQDGHVCVTDPMAHFLLCLDRARVAEVQSDVKKTLSQRGGSARADLEASTVRGIVTKYGADSSADVSTKIKLCAVIFFQDTGDVRGAQSAAPAPNQGQQDAGAQPKAPVVATESTIVGVVRDGRDGVVAYADVMVVQTSERTTTTSAGEFSLSSSRQGRVTLRISHPSFDSTDTEVSVPSESLVLRFSRRRESMRTMPQRRCIPRANGSEPGPCAVYCGKGPGNIVYRTSTNTADSDQACESLAGTICWSKPGVDTCTYKFTPAR